MCSSDLCSWPTSPWSWPYPVSRTTTSSSRGSGGCGVLLAQWGDLFIPINKKLWTASYVFHTVGLDLLILPVVIFIIEHLGKKGWTPFFEVFGRNTLFIYLLSEVIVISLDAIPAAGGSLYGWIYSNIFANAGAATGSFLFGAWVMLTCWLVGKILDRKGIYIRV